MATRVGPLALLLACLALHACSERPDSDPPAATVSVLPAQPQVPAGTVTTLTFRFTPAADLPPPAGDHLVFLHVMRGEHRVWADDHEPSPPVPEWTPGTPIAYTRDLFVPRAVPPGPVSLQVGLYAPSTGERLPLAGAEPAGMRAYRAASFEVTPPAGRTPLFVDGWYGPEGASSGEEWQWASGRAQLGIDNPKRDATLLLIVDQPAPIGRAQAVTVHVAEAVVDTFEVAPGTRQVRRIPLTTATLGPHAFTRVELTIDPPFVPARIPALASTDPRELGVRLLGIYLE